MPFFRNRTTRAALGAAIFSVSVFAAAFRPNSTVNDGVPVRSPAAFLAADELRAADAPRGFAKLVPSVVQYFAETPECAKKPCTVHPCTGVFISNEGHFLTALHCLESTGIFRDEFWNETELTIHHFDADLVSNHPFKIRLLNNGKAAGSTDATIVASGAGYRSPFKQHLARRLDEKKYLRVIESDIGTVGDFVILKLSQKVSTSTSTSSSSSSSSSSSFSCASAAFNNVAPNTGVWGLTFPERTERHDGYDSPGFKRLYTEGKVTNGVAENQAFQERLGSLSDQEARRSEFELYHASMDREGSFASTLDLGAGSSGSPVFSREGQLIGILISVESFSGDPGRQFFSGMARAVSTSRIKQMVPDTSVLFNCR